MLKQNSNRSFQLIKVLSDFIFPPVCACCGTLLASSTDVICSRCVQSRFEPDIDTDTDVLPHFIIQKYALWRFDKQGYLQDLLHKLKYERLTGIGFQLGREIGKSMSSAQFFPVAFTEENSVLVPVPLYRRKLRKRGYNQARVIANGISDVISVPVVAEGAVNREKNTTTQTGLNSEERIRNLERAFRVKQPELLQGKIPVIVDDVYTTGATTFELAAELFRCSGERSAIVTISRT